MILSHVSHFATPPSDNGRLTCTLYPCPVFGEHYREIQNGRLNIKEATLNGPTLNMAGQGKINLSDRTLNLTILVAPFKTINNIINNIPLVNKIIGRTLVSIPVQVTGNLEDPKVIPLTPQVIGEDVLGIMKRTLELPFKVIEGIIPSKKDTLQ